MHAGALRNIIILGKPRPAHVIALKASILVAAGLICAAQGEIPPRWEDAKWQFPTNRMQFLACYKYMTTYEPLLITFPCEN